MHGLLQRRKARSAPLAESVAPSALPEPSDPGFAAALAAHRERASALAVANGLPAVGARMTNAHGIEWLVDGHTFADSMMTLGIAEGEDPRLLYPVVVPQNVSERMGRMVAQLGLCTPKEIVPLDALPHLRPALHAPHSHSVDAISDPYRILLFLDATRIHETVLAHELGHVWIDVVEGVEDHRVLEDLSETVRYGQVQLLQSFVLDFAVNDLVRRRGFDLTPILDDRRITLEQMALAVAKGYRPPTPWEAVQMATLMAEAMVEEDACPVRSGDALARVREGLPEEWVLASNLAATVRDCPPTSVETAMRTIDRVLTLCFAHAGEHLDLERDLIHVPPRVEWRDKWPGWLDGLNPQQKAEVGRAMARQDVGPQARWELMPAGDTTLARFQEDRGEWTEAVALPFRHPRASSPYEEARRIMEMNAANQRRQEERTKAPTTPPSTPGPLTPQGPKIPGPPKPFTPPMPGRRPYSTGLGRFITQVRMDQMLAGESPYGYALNNPVTYVDPTGDGPVSPQGSNFGSCGVFSCSEHSGIFNGTPIASHRYTCVQGPGGGCSGGLYPSGGAVSGGTIGNQSDSCKSRSSPYPVECRLITTDCSIAAAICACNKKSIASPPEYIFPVQSCYTYVNILFGCACDSLSGTKKLDCLNIIAYKL